MTDSKETALWNGKSSGVGGGGGVKLEKTLGRGGGGMDIFWNHTIRKNLTCTTCTSLVSLLFSSSKTFIALILVNKYPRITIITIVHVCLVVHPSRPDLIKKQLRHKSQ